MSCTYIKLKDIYIYIHIIHIGSETQIWESIWELRITYAKFSGLDECNRTCLSMKLHKSSSLTFLKVVINIPLRLYCGVISKLTWMYSREIKWLSKNVNELGEIKNYSINYHMTRIFGAEEISGKSQTNLLIFLTCKHLNLLMLIEINSN